MASSRSRRQTLDQNVILEEEEYNSPIELDEELGAASMAEGMQGSSQKGKRKVHLELLRLRNGSQRKWSDRRTCYLQGLQEIINR